MGGLASLILAGGALTLVSAAVAGEQTMNVKASAYNSTPAQTDADPNEGAWGDAIKPGMKVIAVSSDLVEAGLNRGIRVEIEGLSGTWTVLDRTASRHRNRIDIYMGVDVDAAREWGIKDATISWPAGPESLDGVERETQRDTTRPGLGQPSSSAGSIKSGSMTSTLGPGAGGLVRVGFKDGLLPERACG